MASDAPAPDPLGPLPPPPTLERLQAAVGVLRRLPAPAVIAAGVVVAAALVAVVVWASRPEPVPPELSLPSVADTASGPTVTATPADVVVQAAGAVVTPGVYRLPAASRVVDLVEAAGGLAADADPDQVLLAAPLTDGERVYVPRVGEAPPAGATANAAGAAPGPPALVDLNAATLEELDTLPGVGPATASAILAHRDAHGPFTAVDQLLEVRGIGPAKLEALRDLVRV